MRSIDNEELLDVIVELYGQGWTKQNCKWIDPIDKKAFKTIDEAYEQHRQYQEADLAIF